MSMFYLTVSFLFGALLVGVCALSLLRDAVGWVGGNRIGMRWRTVALVAVAALAIAILTPLVLAATHTLTYTAGADTVIQGTIIPEYNRRHCLQFNQASGCTSANLVTGGCVVKVFPYKGQSLTIDSCTIFTADAAGEDPYLQEITNRHLSDEFVRVISRQTEAACANFKALSQGSQNTICASLGAPVPATNCDICQ